MQKLLIEDEIAHRNWDEKTLTNELFADTILEIANHEETTLADHCVILWMCLVMERRPAPNGMGNCSTGPWEALIKKLRAMNKRAKP